MIGSKDQLDYMRIVGPHMMMSFFSLNVYTSIGKFYVLIFYYSLHGGLINVK